ncbi:MULTISPECIES: nuclear transport factor 2 family protein [unclassified Nocardioides]|jgi:ketosteroid isomerase-like protein|uniref:nuclear transport factor 2 family protein n=1 Tax=Nocardioides sp. URHA0032 TaxID=1380388 RepID=UPI00048C6BFC|nr:nuclear transport factor 2 family protein [Nocardioides sp. URHA0032]
MTRPDFLTRLLAATNDHDVEGIVACFSDEYVNVVPCHPARGFAGREQVRRNWTTILAAVPDLVAEVVDSVRDGDRIWSEWEMRGTRRDGVAHLMRGVLVFTLHDDVAAGLRFFMEPVDEAPVDVDRAVAGLIGGDAP